MNRPFRFAVLTLATVAIAATIVACATNPVTGAKDIVLLSEEQEIALGRQNDPQIRRQYGVYNDPALQAYVQRVGEQLAAHSHRPNLIYRFTVLDSSEVNAFALPGGYIYITRGILAYLNSEAELAAVLGHETGHVTARHAVRQYTAATATGFAVSILGGGQAGQQLLNILGNALLSGYGRDHELQADHLGAEYIARAGYDPEAMIGVMSVLKNQEEAEKKRAAVEGRQPQIYHGVFASHPSADQRLQEVVADARKFKTGTTVRTGRDEYLNRLDRLVFGDSASEGIRHGSNFYHRNLDFAVNFPSGWRIENTPKAVHAYAPGKDAMMQLIVEDLNRRVTPQEYLHSRVKTNAFMDERALDGNALPSHTAVVRLAGPFGVRETRAVVLYYHNRAFTFFGVAKDNDAFQRLDASFLAAARSLHALTDKERAIAEGLRLRVIKVRAGESFATLAKRSPLNDYAELTLRLINDKFASGEPVAGELLKIIE
jgi:predicted Zn-dependent protease